MIPFIGVKQITLFYLSHLINLMNSVMYIINHLATTGRPDPSSMLMCIVVTGHVFYLGGNKPEEMERTIL